MWSSLRLAPITTAHPELLDECTTLWGEPERMYMQKVEQLHVSSECN